MEFGYECSFLILVDFNSIETHGIYEDLLREFVKNGHNVYVVSPTEARKNVETHLIESEHVTILKQKIGNVQKTNVIEKGISTITLENKIIGGIKKYFNNVKFDLILYSTPPITLCKAIDYVKKRDNAKTYLLLKDIFPQNAVDLGMLSTTGIKGLIYKYFRHKEKKLYALSDYIGCMSQANVDFALKHNPEVNPAKLEVCPNSVEPVDMSATPEERIEIRNKYSIPLDKKVFVYGGNLGMPQGIDFLIKCLKAASDTGAHFLVVGDGTEYGKLEKYVTTEKPGHVKLMKRLPKADYDKMIGSCDVGLVFLDYRFTIPNFPSRILSYMQSSMPVLVVSDPNTDMGNIVRENGFRWKCLSIDTKEFIDCVKKVIESDINEMGKRSREYLENNYDVKRGYEIIIKHFE